MSLSRPKAIVKRALASAPCHLKKYNIAFGAVSHHFRFLPVASFLLARTLSVCVLGEGFFILNSSPQSVLPAVWLLGADLDHQRCIVLLESLRSWIEMFCRSLKFCEFLKLRSVGDRQTCTVAGEQVCCGL